MNAFAMIVRCAVGQAERGPRRIDRVCCTHGKSACDKCLHGERPSP